MSSVVDKDEAEKVAVRYTPRRFPQMVSPAAKDFVSHQSSQVKPSFRIDPINAIHTGVAELERESTEQQVERLALEKLKQIQEVAYREAYQLGLDEGRERAFTESKAVLEEKLGHFDGLLVKISTLKTELATANEAYLMKLLFFMASRVAMDEIRTRPEAILTALRQAVESAQSEEMVVAKVSKSDLEFILASAEKLGKGFEFVKRIKLEESEAVQPGGCIVETNYGSVDASVARRVEKLWEAISEKLPRVGDTLGDT